MKKNTLSNEIHMIKKLIEQLDGKKIITEDKFDYSDYYERDLIPGDIVTSKSSGKTFIVKSKPYLKSERPSMPGNNIHDLRSFSYVVDLIEKETGKNYYSEISNLEKIGEEDSEERQDVLRKIEEVNRQRDIITQGLIDMHMFEPSEFKSGEMFSSLTDGKLVHNQTIRDAISKITKENNIDNSVAEHYWKNFW